MKTIPMKMILTFDYKSKSQVINSSASFQAIVNRDCFKNYMQGDFEKVYLGDDKACNILGKRDVHISLPNETT